MEVAIIFWAWLEGGGIYCQKDGMIQTLRGLTVKMPF